MASKLDWLMEEEEFVPAFKLPEGGSFKAGQIGEYRLGALYTILVQGVDLDTMNIAYDGKRSNPNSDWVSYYWTPDNKEVAAAAAETLGQNYGPSFVWHFMMLTSTMLGFNAKDKTAQEVFGEKMEFDIPLVGWGSAKHVEFQLIMLPSLVQAVALKYKMIEKPVYDYNDLPMHRGDDNAPQFTPELEKYYLGEEGKLVQARKDLWAALGEENWQAYTLDKGTKFSVQSNTLRRLVSIVYKPDMEMWLRVARIWDPRANAVKKNTDKHLTTRVVLDFYMDETEAREAAGVESENDGLPDLPEIWRGSKKSDFVDQVRDFLTENKYVGSHPKLKGKSLISLDAATIAKQLETLDLEPTGATLEELLPWLEHVLEK